MKKCVIEEDIQQIEYLISKIADDIKQIERMGGMTNHTYKVLTNKNKTYVVRIPGKGTEAMICREDERVSTILACNLGIDSSLLYFGEDGSKITEYIEEAVTLDNERMKSTDTICDIAAVLRTLHTCGEDTGIVFDVFEMADTYSSIIEEHGIAMYSDYPSIKARVMQIKDLVDRQSEIQLVPCHNDPLCENWVYGKDRLYLIDWEYAGMNDSMWDLADVSVEAGFNDEQDNCLLEKYLEHTPNKCERMRFIANKLYLDYLWTLWGKARVPFDGEAMEEYALGRYNRLRGNLNKLSNW
ncbi:MAG: phosphotransferase family protein [Clostridia bacterium]|nr:phosphotransferase family protein [Clostridia bacterium]